MSLLKFISGFIITTGLITAAIFGFADNYLVREMNNLSVEMPSQQISFYEKEDVSKTNAEADSGEISEAELKTMMSKLASGRDLLDKFWREKFAGQKIRYSSPQVEAFTEAVNTPCGIIEGGNAAYCSRDHTIYFDINFFARMMKVTGENLNSDGDMAVIAILAHEWGHAIQAQTSIGSNVPIYNELQADCLSGAFARYADQKGVLEKGDTEEAAFAFAIGGDSAPWYSVDAHGNSQMRVGSFKLGFQNGVEGCVNLDKRISR